MSKFTEVKLEQAFIKLLENEGFPHYLGNTISRADDEVLIEDDLKNYIASIVKCKNEGGIILPCVRHGSVILEF